MHLRLEIYSWTGRDCLQLTSCFRLSHRASAFLQSAFLLVYITKHTVFHKTTRVIGFQEKAIRKRRFVPGIISIQISICVPRPNSKKVQVTDTRIHLDEGDSEQEEDDENSEEEEGSEDGGSEEESDGKPRNCCSRYLGV